MRLSMTGDLARANTLRAALLGCLLTSAATLTLPGAATAQVVPTDASGGCQITPATVASFFQSGTVTLNGVAKPADSTQVFSGDANCMFFQWSEQMFLWLTSPAPASYGGNSLIMFSPKFFTVSPAGSGGSRSFVPNSPGLPIQMLVRATELGPHELPALMARSGQVIEVRRPAPGRPAAPIIRLQGGGTVQLGKVTAAPNGTLKFFDPRGREVRPRMLPLPAIARPRIATAPNKTTAIVPRAAVGEAIQADKFIVNRVPIFIDPFGNVIDVEPGQADSGVLISQNGALVYYITTVNDVYAYHRTMQGATIPNPTTIVFPLTTADASAVTAFAASKGHTIIDPEALAVETKSSWVEASSVQNPNDYLQVTAIVPTFDKSNPNQWVASGQATVRLVMVGLHVVGSLNGRRAMVWSTYEHQGNAPSATYSYSSTNGSKMVNQDTAGNWLFTPSGSAGPFNVAKASVNGTAIVGAPVNPSPVLRAKPWGGASIDPSAPFFITAQVISTNANVISQLDPVDVRTKYFQLGAIWQNTTLPPTPSNQRGSGLLANATIETFVQGASPSAPSTNCFGCHMTNTVQVSHVYGALKPLP